MNKQTNKQTNKQKQQKTQTFANKTKNKVLHNVFFSFLFFSTAKHRNSFYIVFLAHFFFFFISQPLCVKVLSCFSLPLKKNWSQHVGLCGKSESTYLCTRIHETNFFFFCFTNHSPVSQNVRPRAVTLTSYTKDNKITKNTVSFTRKDIWND